MASKILPKDQTDQAIPNKTKTMRELGPVDISSIREDILNLPHQSLLINLVKSAIEN